MQTIETRYLGPTNTKGSRIVATTSSGKRIIRHIDNAESIERNHKRVARELAVSLGWLWSGTFQGGHTSRGMVWVFIDPANQFIVVPRS